MRQLYRLRELICAVYVSGEQIGAIKELPEGSVVFVIGDAKVPGLTEVECNGEHYALFHEDLVYRAEDMWVAPASGVRVRLGSNQNV